MSTRRLHPYSVVRKALASGGQLALFGAFFAFTSGDRLGIDGPLAAVAIGIVAFLVGAGYRVAYYYRFSYELTEEELVVASGVFARQQREIPLDRVQNVDISRPLTTRLLGLAVVKFETAGGSATEATLDAVSASEADRLQREAGPRGGRGERDETDPEVRRVGTEASAGGRTLYAIDDRELALLSAVSFRPGAFAVPFVGVPFGGNEVIEIYGRVFQFLGIDFRELAAMDAVALVGLAAATVAAYLVAVWVVSAVLTYLQYYGFRLERYGDELRYERGLLGRYSGTIPLDKVQTVTVAENVVARRVGYAALAVETAGYAPGSDNGGSETTVPLATRDRVLALARDVLAASDHTGRYETDFSDAVAGGGTPGDAAATDGGSDDSAHQNPRTTDTTDETGETSGRSEASGTGETATNTTKETDETATDRDGTNRTGDAGTSGAAGDASAETEDGERPVVDPTFSGPEPAAKRWYRRRYLLRIAVLTAVTLAATRVTPLPTLAGLAPLVLVPLAPVAAGRKYAHRGYHETDWSLLTRAGFWRRRTRIVPSFRLQTVIRTRSPFQRRWGLASVTADTASSASLVGGDATVHDVAPERAEALADRLLDRLTGSLAERKRVELARRRADESPDSGRTADGDGATADEQTDGDDSVGERAGGGERVANGSGGTPSDDETDGHERAPDGVPDADDPDEPGSAVDE